MNEIRRTTCNRDCPDACGILAHVENGRITRLQGDPEHPVTRGFLCYRTNHFLPLQYGKTRVTTPLLRRTRGERLQPVSWDEALDFAAEKLVRIRDESGPAAIFDYQSGGSLGLLKNVTSLFFAHFGPVTTKQGSICSGAGDEAQLVDFGECDSHDLFDVLNAKTIVLWGKNVFTSSPHLIPILREARGRGAKVVLIDPVSHKTATIADEVVQPRPAGDFALAMAIARVLFDRGWTCPEAPSYCDHLDEFAAFARTKTLDAWCAEADVAPAVAEGLARAFGPGKPAAILVGWGMGRRRNGAAIVRALDAIAAISGNLGIPGGGVSFYFKRRGAFDTSIFAAPPPPRMLPEALFATEVPAASDPPIRAVWVTAANPMAMLPDTRGVEAALRSRELVVVVDPFLTDTAQLADLVLPTTTLLEADDLHGSYGHHWLGVARPVVPPPPGVRSDLEIIQGLAARVGLEDVVAGDARAWKERLVGPKLAAHGVTLATLEAGPVRNPLAAKVLFEDRVFKTASGRVNLLTSGGEPESFGDPSVYPLTLMSLATEDAQCSQWSRELEGPAVATVHPEAANGIADGALARLETEVGAMEVRVKHDARQRRDVVLVPKGGHMSKGRCANALIAGRTTDLGYGGALYDQRARVVPCREPVT